jgi:hypothetical protein
MHVSRPSLDLANRLEFASQSIGPNEPILDQALDWIIPSNWLGPAQSLNAYATMMGVNRKEKPVTDLYHHCSHFLEYLSKYCIAQNLNEDDDDASSRDSPRVLETAAILQSLIAS